MPSAFSLRYFGAYPIANVCSEMARDFQVCDSGRIVGNSSLI